MLTKHSCPVSGCIIETLENRTLMCGTAGVAAVDQGGAVAHPAVEVSAALVRKAATKTTLAVSAGTLNQPITFSVMVRAAAAAGSPAGTVNILNHGQVIESITLSPTTSTNPKYAFSEGTATLTFQPGGSAPFIGRHPVSAKFIPTGAFLKSGAAKVFAVSKPAYTISGDVGIETIAAGSGPAIQVGQMANVLYTGYLAKNGRIFDDSINDGGTPFNFTIGAGQVIPGFDEGALGMQVGETRIVLIPPAAGYGRTGSPPAIPGNATLIFVLTLESIT
jgi:peptidylprolyl isomerase